MLPIIQVVALQGVGAGVPHDPLLLQARRDGELVHGGVGLRGGVVRRGNAAARLAAVVAVSVVHGTVSIFKGWERKALMYTALSGSLAGTAKPVCFFKEWQKNSYFCYR